MALWRVAQAAEYLGIRPKTLYEWVRQGRVPYRKIGFNVRFDPEELEEWTEGQARGDGSAHEAASASPEARPQESADRAGGEPLQELAMEAARLLRKLERDVGTSLSFPQRRRISELADRLQAAAAGDDIADPSA